MFRLPMPIVPLLVVLTVLCRAAIAQNGSPMLETRGQTMGTTYTVKIFDPPKELASDWREQIDAELRRVNDQMSTYLESSELSRFNRSESTDWFEVSAETAMVVAKSLEIFELSGGAFEVTIAPLVNAWSFGPGKRNHSPPDDEAIAASLEKVGSSGISVQNDPPALRKSNPKLTIDLSAIAKGHGVDRVIGVINRLGAKNVFVEIGGEVRVTGDKAGKRWTVGIQMPDVAGDFVAVAYPIAEKSIATSGDYRNFFEHEGVKYSHTIDPRTGRPVQHDLASVSVVADDCMTADGWATALNVLGTEKGLALASKLGLDTLLISRVADGGYKAAGTGVLAELADPASESTTQVAGNTTKDNGGPTILQAWLPLLAFCFVAFAGVLTAMAVGVMAGRRSISGSCGGLANKREPDGSIACALCSNPDNACKELKAKMQSKVADESS